MNKILESIWPSILWTAIVFILLAMPMGNSKGTGILDLVEFDKLVHIILFAIFSFLWGNYFANKIERKQFFVLITVVLVASVYGLAMEFYQKNFTQRNFSILDAFADAIGAIIGASIAKKSPYGNRGRNQN